MLLALLLLGQFLVVLDVSVVNVALPAMQDGLALDSAGLQWVVNGYTIAFAGFLLSAGASRTSSAGAARSSPASRSSRPAASWEASPPLQASSSPDGSCRGSARPSSRPRP